MKYRLVIFDLDGTILNTIADLADGVNFAMQKKGFPLKSKNEVEKNLGHGIRYLVKECMPRGSSECEVDETLNYFKAYYSVHCLDKTKPYKGVKEMVLKLKEMGIKVAVLSNKIDSAVKALVEKNYPNLFDLYYGERNGIPKKPCPDAVWALISDFGVKKEETLYVGDSEVDYETAKNAGVDCCLVDYGFRRHDFLMTLGDVTIISKPNEILNYVKE